MKKIKLTKGQSTIVDDCDFESLSGHKWCVSKGKGNFYAARSEDGRTILMHRQIIDAPQGMDVDHINHNGLDNRRFNLRACTRSQNLGNQRKQRNATFKYKGICWEHTNSWSARICLNYTQIYLGTFKSEFLAAKAYDYAAKRLFGEFAYLNFHERKLPIWFT